MTNCTENRRSKHISKYKIWKLHKMKRTVHEQKECAKKLTNEKRQKKKEEERIQITLILHEKRKIEKNTDENYR